MQANPVILRNRRPVFIVQATARAGSSTGIVSPHPTHETLAIAVTLPPGKVARASENGSEAVPGTSANGRMLGACQGRQSPIISPPRVIRTHSQVYVSSPQLTDQFCPTT
jgi:hypothetical protein